MIELGKMSTRGRLTIPKKIRDEMGLKPGDRVTFTGEEGYILMQLVREDQIDSQGSVPTDGDQDNEEIR